MSPTLDAFLRSWPFDPWLAATLACSRRRSTCAAGAPALAAIPGAGMSADRPHFCGGLAAIFLALASPIEPFAALLLQVHMLQHLLLMMVAPPLIWLGWPLFPLLRGLPEPMRTYWVAPLLRWRPTAHAFAFLRTSVGGVAAVRRRRPGSGTCRAGYELGLEPRRLAYRRARLLPCQCAFVLVSRGAALSEPPTLVALASISYLLLADVQNTVLAAWLRFRSSCCIRITARAAAGRDLGARRSSDGRRADVGARLDRLLVAAVLDRRRLSV